MTSQDDNIKPERGADDSRKPRSDGAQSRERLLLTAIRLFAERGFANSSTRDIALAAGANVAAISYYFGDKAGLYRACFNNHSAGPQKDIEMFDQPHFTLRQSLEGFYAQLMVQMGQGDLAQLCMRLWFREMLEPTGLWAEEIVHGIQPVHLALVGVLARHLGVAKAGDALHRLAFSIAGLGLHIMITRDVIESIRPQLLATPEAFERWSATLADYALALVGAEQTRLHKGIA
ncbi:AcrR family transcriptional regulator [Oxalobacteraceae bacterium GrIS 1.11]